MELPSASLQKIWSWFIRVSGVIGIWLLLYVPTFAQTPPQKYFTLVTLVRGQHRWVDSQDWLAKHIQLSVQKDLAGTWLVDYDVLSDTHLVRQLQGLGSDQEVGLFVEITPHLARTLGLPYDYLSPPHKPHNTFTTGYTLEQKKRILDYLVTQYNQQFGTLPKSAGAWFIDSWSLGYLNETYGIDNVLLVAEQYGTDHHTIRGHVWQQAYYPSKEHSLVPGFGEDKLNTVIIQWAVREPLRGYGYYREYSNYSVQANDYTQQGETVNYFDTLVTTYLNSSTQQLQQLTIGIEVGQEGATYFDEYVQLLEHARESGHQFIPMSEFGYHYRHTYPESPSLRSTTFTNTEGTAWASWITTPSYRVGLIADTTGLYIRDLRNYLTIQDDLWISPDRRSNLFRQTQPIIDEVGLHNSWKLKDDFSINQIVVNQTEESITINAGSDSLVFTPKAFTFSFVPSQSAPPELKKHSLQQYELIASPTYFFPLKIQLLMTILIFGLSTGYITYTYLKNKDWLFISAITSIGLWIGLQEIWRLTPFEDLGWSYIRHITASDLPTFLILYVFPIILMITLSVVVYQLVYSRTKNSWLAIVGYLCMWFPPSLSWVFAVYRNLPLDPTLVSSYRPHHFSHMLALDLGIDRLQFAFSAGAMNIQFLDTLSTSPISLLFPQLFFMVINLGVLLLGLIFFMYYCIHTQRWMWFIGTTLMILLNTLTFSSIDIRALTVFDLLLRAISVVGSMYLVRAISMRLTRVMAVSVLAMCILTAIPTLWYTHKRNQSLFVRSEYHWSDKRLTRTFIGNSYPLSDFFISSITATNTSIFIPMGIEDYYFTNSYDIKRDAQQILMENSYAILLEK